MLPTFLPSKKFYVDFSVGDKVKVINAVLDFSRTSGGTMMDYNL